MATHGYMRSNCTVLDVGCYLQYWAGSSWGNADDYSGVVGGKFAGYDDGVGPIIYCFTVTDGVITAKSICESRLYVYAESTGGSGILEYQIGNGSTVTIGSINTGCSLVDTITGLTQGQTVTFFEQGGLAIAGADSTTCPGMDYGCTYQITMNPGDNYVALTIDSFISC